MGERTRPGQASHFDLAKEAPLVDAPDEHEVRYLIDFLKGRGDIVEAPGPLGKGFTLTVDGWARLEPGPGGLPGRCFVAMSFRADLRDAYENGILAALKLDCQLDPCRVDREEHNDRIDDKIMVEIRKAQFTVADVTFQRQGVYFEAGFAMGLGRPVIWTCREDQLVDVHFDTRQYNHIVWSDPADLRTKLATRVRATIPGVRL